MEVRDTAQETGIKTIPRKRNAKRQNGHLRRPYKQQRRKGKTYPLECRVPKNSKEREESLP